MQKLSLENIKVERLELLNENKNNSIEAASAFEAAIYALLDHRALMKTGDSNELEHYKDLEVELLWAVVNNDGNRIKQSEIFERFASVFSRSGEGVSAKYHKVRNGIEKGESLKDICAKKRGKRGKAKQKTGYPSELTLEQQLLDYARLCMAQAAEYTEMAIAMRNRRS